MIEIIVGDSEDKAEGGYSARALGHSIDTQGDTLEEIHHDVKEAVDCHVDESMPRPKLTRLHFVRDEGVLA